MEGSDVVGATGGTAEVASGIGTENAEVEGTGAVGVVSEGSSLYSVGKERAWVCSI